jgi:hypothetical protein
MSLRLIIEDDEGSTTIVPLGKEAITIGRQQGNTIQLTEKNVSRRHARLFPEGETWVLEDLGSYNGVKVNGRAVEGRVSMREGDVVQIGDYHLALTEDVERRSLNYDRPRSAANDGEPMLASSSTNLPRLSPDELAALSSGQTPVAPPAPPQILVDSGQVPMARAPVGGYPEDRPRKSAGVIIAVGLVGIGVLALGGFWIATQQGERDDGTAIAAASPDPARDAKLSSPPAEAAPPKDTPIVPAPTPTEPAVAPPVEPVPTPPPVEPTPTPAPPVEPEDTVEVEPDPPDREADKPVAKKPPAEKPQAKKPPPAAPKPPPPTPPTPAVDVTQLLADARKANLTGNSASAYDLASKAYAASKSQDAAIVMALAACKMGDAGKAKKAIAKLKGTRRDEAIKVCAGKGITIE